jgi:uncharacterized membrane protein
MDQPISYFDRISGLPDVAHVPASRPLHWLHAGWQDLRRNPWPSVAHGLLLVAVGWLLLLYGSSQIELLAAAVSGYLLVGPIFGAVFYELSRRRAAGEAATFDASLDGALKSAKRLAPLGLLLALLAVMWVLFSGWLFERGFGGSLPSMQDDFYRTILDWVSPMFFATYMATGAVFALLAFVLSAVSAPMIFDREVRTGYAISTSLKAVGANPLAMTLWATLIAALTAVGFATLLFGLALVLPLLGHATWHAYHDLVIFPDGAKRRGTRP